MSTPEREVIDRMFAAFAARDLQGAVATVSQDTVWIHHGTQRLPSLRFEGISGVTQFFSTNFSSMKLEYFEIQQVVEQGQTLVVLGKEKFTIDGQPGALAQKWVQVYTVKNGLITRMEEFASSADDAEYGRVH